MRPVFWITLIAALFLNLDTAIYTGIGVSLIFFLQKASAPTLVEHAFDEQGQLSEIGAPEKRNHPQVSIVHVEGDLFLRRRRPVPRRRPDAWPGIPASGSSSCA
jgi:SulP family sulfate permease